MTPEEIVKRLRDWARRQASVRLTVNEEILYGAADLIERQAKALEMAEQSVLFAKANNEWRSEDKEDFDFVIEEIRKLKGG
jgi:hypothetical protein